MSCWHISRMDWFLFRKTCGILTASKTKASGERRDSPAPLFFREQWATTECEGFECGELRDSEIKLAQRVLSRSIFRIGIELRLAKNDTTVALIDYSTYTIWRSIFQSNRKNVYLKEMLPMKIFFKKSTIYGWHSRLAVLKYHMSPRYSDNTEHWQLNSKTHPRKFKWSFKIFVWTIDEYSWVYYIVFL